EGHAAFMMLERVREQTVNGVEFRAAISEVRRSTIFTTHTPVPAGHDQFEIARVAECVGAEYLSEFGVGMEQVLGLGVHPRREQDQFHMTVLAIRLAGHVNGVAERHGVVSRELWGDLRSEERRVGKEGTSRWAAADQPGRDGALRPPAREGQTDGY